MFFNIELQSLSMEGILNSFASGCSIFRSRNVSVHFIFLSIRTLQIVAAGNKIIINLLENGIKTTGNYSMEKLASVDGSKKYERLSKG